MVPFFYSLPTMKNEEISVFTNPQEESIWKLAKPTNPWSPDTDIAWQSVSMKMAITAATVSIIKIPITKIIGKYTVKKILIWSSIGAFVTAGTIYQFHTPKLNPTVKSKKIYAIIPKASLDTVSIKNEIKTTPIKTSKTITLPKEIKTINKDNSIEQPQSKILQFKQTELQIVTEILSQTYGLNIKIEKAQLLHCKLTATFENEPIQNILEIIQETFNMEIVPSKDTIWLKGGSCQ